MHLTPRHAIGASACSFEDSFAALTKPMLWQLKCRFIDTSAAARRNLLSVIVEKLREMGLSLECWGWRWCCWTVQQARTLESLGKEKWQDGQARLSFLGLQSNGKWDEQVDAICRKVHKVNKLVRNMFGIVWGMTAVQIVSVVLISTGFRALQFMNLTPKLLMQRITSAIAELVTGFSEYTRYVRWVKNWNHKKLQKIHVCLYVCLHYDICVWKFFYEQTNKSKQS